VIDRGAQLWIEHDMAAFLERQSRSTVHRWVWGDPRHRL